MFITFFGLKSRLFKLETWVRAQNDRISIEPYLIGSNSDFITPKGPFLHKTCIYESKFTYFSSYDWDFWSLQLWENLAWHLDVSFKMTYYIMTVFGKIFRTRSWVIQILLVFVLPNPENYKLCNFLKKMYNMTLCAIQSILTGHKLQEKHKIGCFLTHPVYFVMGKHGLVIFKWCFSDIY